jgi:hypothetical protein
MDTKNEGFCQCGCGQKTTIAKRNRYGLGHRQGRPVPCIAGHSRSPRLTDEERAERRTEYGRRYRAAHPGEVRAVQKRWKHANKAKLAAAMSSYRISTPERRLKDLARKMLSLAVAAGWTERQPCEVCGQPAQAHHPDYAKPLEVRWLCPTHHRALHRKGGRS